MTKKVTELTAMLATDVAQDDVLLISDVSAGVSKKITVKNLTGLPDVGYIASGETWSYSSANVITVPTNATTKYSKGMLIRFTQDATTKYAVILSVAATTLTLYMVGSTLSTNAITNTFYTLEFVPFGFQPTQIQISNPVKFRVSQNAAANTGNNAFAVIPFDTEQIDTSNNVTTGVFTAPVGGFYQFNWNAIFTLSAGADESAMTALYKNGVEYSRGSEITYRNLQGSHGSDMVQAVAGDTLDIRAFAPTARALSVGNTTNNYFSGFLISTT